MRVQIGDRVIVTGHGDEPWRVVAFTEAHGDVVIEHERSGAIETVPAGWIRYPARRRHRRS